MVSLILLKKILTLCGGGRGCWVVGQITGVELPQDLDQKILNAKIFMI